MECPHVSNSVKIDAIPMKSDIQTSLKDWQLCSSCKSRKSPWICLHCGTINCGRYVNGHAKNHFESKQQHCVCLDCDSLGAFCYVCDDFIVNDTKSKHIEQIRLHVQTLNQLNHEIVHSRLRNRHNSGDSSNAENRNTKKRKIERSNMDKSKLRVVGLRNLGNTCFMNAVLQSLSNIQEFCVYFKQLPSLEKSEYMNGRKNNCHTRQMTKEQKGDEILMAEELRKTLVALWEGGKSSISPEALFSVIWKVVPRFRGYQQQDAHEFLRYMLDRLHTELLNILPYTSLLHAQNSNMFQIDGQSKSTIVTTIFGGLLQNEVKCLVCGTESKKQDPFLDLSLDIPEQFITSAQPNCNPKNHSGKEDSAVLHPPCHLSDCLQSFTELEELADTELYYCSSCKQKQCSTKKFWIRRLPNVLCLHLKRFRWSNYYRTKLDNHVEFPIRGLDMSRYLLTGIHVTRNSAPRNNMYDLAAVIVHHGTGAGSGHYTAYGSNEGNWYHFNDSTVTKTDEAAVAKCKAYILFYIRRHLKLPHLLAGDATSSAVPNHLGEHKDGPLKNSAKKVAG